MKLLHLWALFAFVSALATGRVTAAQDGLRHLLTKTGHGHCLQWPPPGLEAPVAERRPETFQDPHGAVRVDDYSWLRGDSPHSPDVLAYLALENRYSRAVLEALRPLRDELLAEMEGRVVPSRSTVPVRRGDWWYYERQQEGSDYWVHCRKPAAPGDDAASAATEDGMASGWGPAAEAAEQVLLDPGSICAAAAPAGATYCDVYGAKVSPDGRLVAFGLDTSGREEYLAYVHDLGSGHTLLGTPIGGTSGNYEWSADSSTLFYVTQNGTTSRPSTVWAQQLLPRAPLNAGGGASSGGGARGAGAGASASHFIPPPPVLLAHEPDDAFFLALDASRRSDFLLLTLQSETTAEVRALDLRALARGAPLSPASWRVIGGREHGVRYKAAHWRGGAFLLLATGPGAPNGELRLVAAGGAAPAVVLPPRREVALEDFQLFDEHLVLAERQLGHTALSVYCLPSDGSAAARSACRYNSTTSHAAREGHLAPGAGTGGGAGAPGGGEGDGGRSGGGGDVGGGGGGAREGDGGGGAGDGAAATPATQPGLVIRGRGSSGGGAGGGAAVAYVDMSAMPADGGGDGDAGALLLEMGALTDGGGDAAGAGDRSGDRAGAGAEATPAQDDGSDAAALPPPPLVLAREASWQVAFEEDCYSVALLDSGDHSNRLLRLSYTSFTTPDSVIDIHLDSQARVTRAVRPVAGRFNRQEYRSSRLWAAAADGALVPLSLVYRLDAFRRDGSNPALLMAYGAYGVKYDPQFDARLLSLLDRGWVVAIAHVRGGGELGAEWHAAGRLEHKGSSFSDFVACARALIEQRCTSADRLAAWGRSAGGLTVGGALNAAPELFAAALLDVPFLDVLPDMLDASLPLTVKEWEEWGDPLHNATMYALMAAYSPVGSLRPGRPYPHMLLTGGLNDRRVGFWHPAKWVARLRALGAHPPRLLLLQTDMGGGHFSASGTGSGLGGAAAKYAFLLATLPGCGSPGGAAALARPLQPPAAQLVQLALLALALLMVAAAVGGVTSVLWRSRGMLGSRPAGRLPTASAPGSCAGAAPDAATALLGGGAGEPSGRLSRACSGALSRACSGGLDAPVAGGSGGGGGADAGGGGAPHAASSLVEAACESPPATLLVSPRTLPAMAPRHGGQCVMLERRNSAANGMEHP